MTTDTQITELEAIEQLAQQAKAKIADLYGAIKLQYEVEFAKHIDDNTLSEQQRELWTSKLAILAELGVQAGALDQAIPSGSRCDKILSLLSILKGLKEKL